ncbi:hypothetical protein ASPWEDRAFT_176808 [Aspergillus wentii DTO 134E9]|uniref:Uncharacterized protein n=1 Tax=Aspergillus wentii DTO 134E9 TaxID=1073089 RepID=A0A1L9R5E7_ASPWE|nr:uncharacterized protein ASPWEDRAFT_176808 [Aspergillus wentii DTO 134E9]OJJ30139.1 hypothetical protein ASPWEDRAFT_176808 [Aspergillus wentii DTO 134E9]
MHLSRLVLLASSAVAASVSRQVELGKNDYFVSPEPAWNISPWTPLLNSTEELIPLTVVHLNASGSAQSVKAVLETYNQTDDVWTPDFTKILCIQSQSSKGKSISPSSLGEYSVDKVLYKNSKEKVPAGPYFLNAYTGMVYQAYRLYADTNQAFIQTSYQNKHGVHHNLRAATQSAGGLTVAVPSRLYFTRTSEKPLAGLRLAVKDLYDLKGMKTSGGNRALFEMSKTKNATATAVQKLINAGAIVVGKNKLSEFAYAGDGVPEHIDYLLPFNPRGDGYNSPGDSSGGSAASIASYDWLDASMGSDTGGSIRGPAVLNGIYGNRPSHRAVDLTGALVLSSSMDTSGILARDPQVWSAVNKVLYAGYAKEYRKYPRKIYLDESISRSEYPGVSNFIKGLTRVLQGTHSNFSIADTWANTTHTGSLKQVEIANSISQIYANLTQYEQWTEFGQEYVESCKKTHNGEFPHMSPSTRKGWLSANATMNETMHEELLDQIEQISNWTSEYVFKQDEHTCSDSIYVYTQGAPVASYKPQVTRDVSNPWVADMLSVLGEAQMKVAMNCSTASQDQDNHGQDNQDEDQPTSRPHVPVPPSRLASVAGLPDFALTVGSAISEVVSNSTMLNQTLPYGVDIMTRRGCDFMLQNLISELHREGVIKTVKTGSDIH